MRLLNKFGFDDEAVSPVVGVILMVAITVILAAVIGTFVLDLGGQVSQNAQAGVTFDETEGVETTVQLNSVQNADHIYAESDTGTWDTAGGVGSQTSYMSDNSVATEQALYSTGSSGEQGGVGTTVTLEYGAGVSDGQITVIGVVDGEENIIQTYEYVGGN